ncbi:MAG: ARC6/PARC6 family protein, partial [Cyanobacteriota bacterium]
GSEHQIGQLTQILAEPALSRSQQSARSNQQDGSYCQYNHNLAVNSVDISNANPDIARIDAAVKEAAQCYREGQLNQAMSYDENLRVRYDVIRKQGRWFIQDMTVIR